MSLPFVPSITPGTVSACPLVDTFEVGKQYKLSGHTQGNLGTVDIIAVAVSTSELSSSVIIIGSDILSGIFDWANCVLTYVQDTIGNQIAGQSNIANFPWYLPLKAANNIVSGDSSITFQAFTRLLAFNGNTLISGAVIDTSGSAAGNWTFTDNVIEAGSITGTSAVGNVVISHSRVSSSSSVTIAEDAGTAGTKVIQDTELFGSSELNMGPVTGIGTVTVNRGKFGPEATVNLTGASPMALTDLVVQRGTFDNAGFDCNSCYLAGDNSTLVGDLSDAKKIGYTNALP